MTDAQTDREHLEAIVGAAAACLARAAIDPVWERDGVDAMVLGDLWQTSAAAKQHLDTTKPDGGAAAAWPEHGDPSESLMGCNGARYSTLRVGQNTMRIFGPGVNIDYRASGPDHELLIYVAERAFDATTTPSPNEAEIRADERRRIVAELREQYATRQKDAEEARGSGSEGAILGMAAGLGEALSLIHDLATQSIQAEAGDGA